MKLKSLSFFVGIFLLIGSFVVPSSVHAWSITPQKVTFMNNRGLMLEGWLFKPAGHDPSPAVVMMHGCLGVYSFGDPTQGINSLYREWGNRLVRAGYVALLIDSFTPRGTAQNQCGNMNTGLSEVSIRPYDAYAGLNYLASQWFVDANRIGLLGWSHGASATMAAMDITKFRKSPHFKAAVAFYPGCDLYGAFGGVDSSTWKPYAPFLVLHGSADVVVSTPKCRARVTTAQTLGATNVSIAVFAYAQHGFDAARNVGGRFTQYDVDAKTIADARTMQFFDARLR